MKGIIELQIWQMIAAYVFVVVLLLVVRLKGIRREKEIFIATIRMTLQLILTGYVLVFLFENPSPVLTILFLLVMEVFAVFNIFKRVKLELSTKLKQIIALSMVIGTISCLLYFLLVVVRISPWYDPQYFIPIAGMLIGNSMTGISLGVTRLVDGMQTQKDMVEGA